MAPAFTLLSRFTLGVNRLYLTRVHSYDRTSLGRYGVAPDRVRDKIADFICDDSPMLKNGMQLD